MVETHLAAALPGRTASGALLRRRRAFGVSPSRAGSDSPFALGDEPRSWRDLLGDVAVLAESLPVNTAPEVMVACADRYLCAVALLAVWSTGRLAALPPNSRGRPSIACATSAASR